MVMWYRSLWGQEDQRQKQGARPDRSKRLLGTLGLWLLGETKKRRSDSGAAEMSVERGNGVRDFCLEIA